MKKKHKISLIIIIFVIIIIIVNILLFLKNTTDSEAINVVDSIDDFGYTLDDRDTDLMKNTYAELKNVLTADEIDYEEYAKLLAELFVIDLFTMDNKVNRYDVGSTEYVYPDSIDNFKTNVEDTIYRSMENNYNGKRKQNLPEVSSIEQIEINTDTFEIGDETYDSYVVSISWAYVTDLGYDEFAIITLIQLDEKLYIVEYETGE